MDILLKRATNYIKQNKKSIIEIPILTEKYDIGLGIICYFKVYNTYRAVEDTSTLRRTEWNGMDVITCNKTCNICNKRQIYIIKAGFRLPIAELKYNYYELTGGLITIDGDVLVTVDALGLETVIELLMINDTMHACRVRYVQVMEFGKINIEMTGLGSLGSFISDLITQKISEWREQIIEKIEVYARDIIEEQLNN